MSPIRPLSLTAEARLGRGGPCTKYQEGYDNRTMRSLALFGAILLASAAHTNLLAAPGIVALPSVRVGQNLQAPANVRLTEPAPASGLQITLTSEDPARLLLSNGPEQAGSPSITLKIQPSYALSPEFWMQGRGADGKVHYTVSAPGFGSTIAEVNLAPSAIVVVGPFRAPKYSTTPRGRTARMTIVSAALDAERKSPEEQPVAGGTQVIVDMSNSNPSAGKLENTRLTIAGGSSTASTDFGPMAEGETIIAPIQPRGFATPLERASVAIEVKRPLLTITGDIFLGKNLQTSASLILSEPAPPGGLLVTLTSSDGKKLLLSDKEDKAGSAVLQLAIPAGKQTVPYYLQGLGDSGQVLYAATAPRYRNGEAKIELTASGTIIAYESYGPPDEANVKRKIGGHSDREFFVSLADAKEHPVRLLVWTAYIDRETGRAADFTVQPLRAGMSTTVKLTSSDPSVATVESPSTIQPGMNRAVFQFTPTAKGRTVISIETPEGFSKPQNATSVPAIVRD